MFSQLKKRHQLTSLTHHHRNRSYTCLIAPLNISVFAPSVGLMSNHVCKPEQAKAKTKSRIGAP